MSSEKMIPAERLNLAVWFTIVALLVTMIAAAFTFNDVATIAWQNAAGGEWLKALLQVGFMALVLLLIYGNLVYQVCRLGCLRRRAAHRAVSVDQLRQLHRSDAPSLTVLIPSYREEPDVVRQTLLSAALMEYPHKQIVLLVDDEPVASVLGADADRLAAMRALPDEIKAMLAFPAWLFSRELEAFIARRKDGDATGVDEAARLASLFDQAAAQFETIGGVVNGDDHVGEFFRQRIVATPAADLRARAAFWRAANDGSAPDTARMQEQDYRRLAACFTAQIRSFERKQFANLSHAKNKAMNLNGCIGVMGDYFKEVVQPNGAVTLLPCRPQEATLHIPDSDYLITLDADSLLLSDYALRLVEFMERPENSRVAIAQTPYSAFPDPTGTLERIAGITTDIQHIVHQGFTRYNSTYWVGANALIRKVALAEIATEEWEGDIRVRKFIQDRTVIEDTESTVDLWLNGWSLYNYPDRLAYSATPPDFGSLLIQRRRWANGGLIILPKLVRFIFQRPLSARRLANGWVQVHYLTSLAASSSAVLILLVVYFEDAMLSWWLPLAAAPYFLLYGLDMRSIGYKWWDLPRVYALNLALIPVHLGGVLRSLDQAITGRKSPFLRTPKVQGRTAAPGFYVACVVGLCLYAIGSAIFDAIAARWAHAAFAMVNGLFLLYAVVVFLGLRECVQDIAIWIGRFPPLAKWLAPASAPVPAAANSGAVLHPILMDAIERSSPSPALLRSADRNMS